MIVLIGKTASGKDTILRKLVDEYGYHKLVTYTTRPMRKKEKQDIDYHFISEKDFLKKVDSGFFLEYRKYITDDGVWYYGSAVSDYKKADEKTIVILTPSGLDCLKILLNRNGIDINNITSLYIYANDNTIKERLKKRGDKLKESDRRISTDRRDFSNATNIVDRIFYNNKSNNIDDVTKSIHEYINNETTKGSRASE